MIERWLTAIRDHPDRPAAMQRHVLAMLALRLDWTSGAGFCGIRDLMADADASKRTVMRATNWAIENDYLIRTRRGHYINAQTTIASQWQLTQGATTDTFAQSQGANGSNPRCQPGQPKVPVGTTHQESSSSKSSSSARGQASPMASPRDQSRRQRETDAQFARALQRAEARDRLEDPARLDLGAVVQPRTQACKAGDHRLCLFSWCTCTCGHPGRQS